MPPLELLELELEDELLDEDELLELLDDELLDEEDELLDEEVELLDDELLLEELGPVSLPPHPTRMELDISPSPTSFKRKLFLLICFDPRSKKRWH